MGTKERESTGIDSDSSEVEIKATEKKRKHDLTPVDIQRQQVERLLQRADKPVNIPEILDKPKLKAPKDIVRNVQVRAPVAANSMCIEHIVEGNIHD
ncbi:10251_t:CDS:2 [Acaulospora colombiana]|uniref:10251_t:CDS:1 n=1 Tax=Acaulospora colombiana TaxID=27376 RepID=A0ACA9M9N4_9GLOM|nr:10251_t:CDS:2 [Acaulospora colombiana]